MSHKSFYNYKHFCTNTHICVCPTHTLVCVILEVSMSQIAHTKNPELCYFLLYFPTATITQSPNKIYIKILENGREMMRNLTAVPVAAGGPAGDSEVTEADGTAVVIRRPALILSPPPLTRFLLRLSLATRIGTFPLRVGRDSVLTLSQPNQIQESHLSLRSRKESYSTSFSLYIYIYCMFLCLELQTSIGGTTRR